jgi:polysaccharide export outer membrane protein
VLCVCACAHSQQGAGEQTAATGTELKPNPLTALRAFEAPANEEYTLGRGDEISIDFAGHPELTVKKIVGPDGRITLPPGGSIQIADKTREQAAEVIAASLSPYYTRLSVTVGIDKYTSNHVLLLGAVEHPGVVSFDAPPTLLEVLTVGGGVSKGTQTSTLLGPTGVVQPLKMASAMPERVAIYRGQEQVLWVDVKGLIDSGSALADLRLRRGDVVYVPSAAERYVSVLGQVTHPGALQLDKNTTLQKLLAEAGGLTLLAGKNPTIEVISSTTGKSRGIPFKTLLQPGTLDLTLNSGDVVFVTESGFNQAAYAFEKISPLINLFTTAALFNRQ